MVLISRKHIPNILTMMRLLLAICFFGTLNAYRYPDINVWSANIAILFFVLAAATDFVDGILARRWDAITAFGRIMDPFCDKVLILGGFVYLAGPRFVVPEWVDDHTFFTMSTGVYPWMVALIFARELLVTAVRGVVEAMGVKLPANWCGKMKMGLQSTVIPLILILVVNFKTGSTTWAMYTCHALIYTTLVITTLSGIPYVLDLRYVLRNNSMDGP